MTGETDDTFLGGRLRVIQPARGYRAGTDAVLLAAAVPASPGETILELGSGTGVVLLCLGTRIPGLSLTGIERLEYHAALARRNFERNAIVATLLEADIRQLPREVKEQRFDHVISNPPFLDRRHGKRGGSTMREQAIAAAELPLAEWARIGMKRVRPGGHLTMIAPAERLPDLLQVLGGRGVSVLPISSRTGRDPSRVIVSAKQGGRARFRLRSPLVSHRGLEHQDGDHFTSEMRAVLREGTSLNTTID